MKVDSVEEGLVEKGRLRKGWVGMRPVELA